MTIDEDFYNSALAEEMANELRNSNQNKHLHLLKEGRSILEKLRSEYSSSIKSAKTHIQELEVQFCHILIMLWEYTDAEQRKKITVFLISCCKRLASFL